MLHFHGLDHGERLTRVDTLAAFELERNQGPCGRTAQRDGPGQDRVFGGLCRGLGLRIRARKTLRLGQQRNGVLIDPARGNIVRDDLGVLENGPQHRQVGRDPGDHGLIQRAACAAHGLLEVGRCAVG